MSQIDFLLYCIRTYAKEKNRDEVEVFKQFSRNRTLDYIVDNYYILEKSDNLVKELEKHINS